MNNKGKNRLKVVSVNCINYNELRKKFANWKMRKIAASWSSKFTTGVSLKPLQKFHSVYNERLFSLPLLKVVECFLCKACDKKPHLCKPNFSNITCLLGSNVRYKTAKMFPGTNTLYMKERKNISLLKIK